ncbi:hypothetical protein D050_3369 [Vibrio parahaemolyticus VPCR-2009]|nr:hypothetical protein D050_3369 [Vibrio parahaemolyticus VPCR-2009]
MIFFILACCYLALRNSNFQRMFYAIVDSFGPVMGGFEWNNCSILWREY